jgi:hypothetical protein
MNPDDVTHILAGAVKAVTDAKVPPDLAPVAFEKAIDMLAGPRPVAASTTATLGVPTSVAAPTTPTGSAIDRLATRLHLSHEVVEAVFTENGDELAISVPPDRLAKAKSAGAREIALLVAAARQSSSDDPTTTDQIRRAVEDYNRFDGPNFASSLSPMKGTFLVAGPSRSRTFKLTKPGWTAAASLVGRLGAPDKSAS